MEHISRDHGPQHAWSQHFVCKSGHYSLISIKGYWIQGKQHELIMNACVAVNASFETSNCLTLMNVSKLWWTWTWTEKKGSQISSSFDWHHPGCTHPGHAKWMCHQHRNWHQILKSKPTPNKSQIKTLNIPTPSGSRVPPQKKHV